MESNTFFASIFAALMALLLTVSPVASAVRRSKGQTVYVPAYSHIYHGDSSSPFYLAVTLSIRNTDPVHPITILSVNYFDSDGNLLRNYQEGEKVLRPMGSIEYVVKESDKKGGSGANFIVTWKSDIETTEPLIEAIMISTALQQGVSFSSRGQVIEEY